MAKTMSATTIHNNQSVSDGGSDVAASADLVAAYGGMLYLKITNGANAPATAGRILVEWSPDNSNWFQLVSMSGNTSSNGVKSLPFELPIGIHHLRATVGGNSGGSSDAVTYLVIADRVTAL